jgi:polyisoprenoid-binding protein YceI
MKIIYTIALLSALLVSCENPADKTATAKIEESKTTLSGEGTKFIFTDHSTIEFTGSKITGSHSGGFKDLEGHFTLSEGETSPNSGTITIKMDSTYSDAEKLTGHLKSADFFDVEKFPTSTFTMTQVKETGNQAYEISGNFTLHGITKHITFPASAERSGDTATVRAEFDINRKEFGIVYAGKTDDLIRDEVVIRFNLESKSQ